MEKTQKLGYIVKWNTARMAWDLLNADGKIVGILFKSREEEKDAHLIAAAPKLRECLIYIDTISDWVNIEDREDDEIVELHVTVVALKHIRAALQVAGGKA